MTSTDTTSVWPGQKMTAPMERDPVSEQKALTQVPFRGSGGQKMTALGGLSRVKPLGRLASIKLAGEGN